ARAIVANREGHEQQWMPTQPAKRHVREHLDECAQLGRAAAIEPRSAGELGRQLKIIYLKSQTERIQHSTACCGPFSRDLPQSSALMRVPLGHLGEKSRARGRREAEHPLVTTRLPAA